MFRLVPEKSYRTEGGAEVRIISMTEVNTPHGDIYVFGGSDGEMYSLSGRNIADVGYDLVEEVEDDDIAPVEAKVDCIRKTMRLSEFADFGKELRDWSAGFDNICVVFTQSIGGKRGKVHILNPTNVDEAIKRYREVTREVASYQDPVDVFAFDDVWYFGDIHLG